MSRAVASSPLPPTRSRGHGKKAARNARPAGAGELVAGAVAARRIPKAATVTGNAAKPLIVEFVGGIPAAGKTTVARACRALGTSLGYPVYLNVKGLSKTQMVRAFVGAPLFWRFLYQALKVPLFTRQNNETVLGHRWRCLIEVRLYFALLYEFMRRHPNSVVILDQWISRKLDVIRDERRASEVFRFVVESDVYFDKYYVFLDLPIESALDRGWQRTWLRKSGESDRWYREHHLDRETLRQYYLEKQARYEKRYSRFAAHGLNVLRLDAERPPEENARLIIDRLVQPYVTNGRAWTSWHQVRHRNSPRVREAHNALES
jgi:hypothetical protein